MPQQKNNCELILALDLDSSQEVQNILKKIGNQLQWVKIGLQLFTKYGPDIVHKINQLGYKIFLDLKMYDIPNTVSSAIKSLQGIPANLLSLHTSGGPEMIQWSKKARDEIQLPLNLIGITVLTSFNQDNLNAIGVQDSIESQVQRLGKLGLDSGLDGLVCSPHELPILRKTLGHKPILIVPGIRPLGSNSNEQKRIMTPSQAAKLGANFIVVGRPILQSPSPQSTVSDILHEINQS